MRGTNCRYILKCTMLDAMMVMGLEVWGNRKGTPSLQLNGGGAGHLLKLSCRKRYLSRKRCRPETGEVARRVESRQYSFKSKNRKGTWFVWRCIKRPSHLMFLEPRLSSRKGWLYLSGSISVSQIRGLPRGR